MSVAGEVRVPSCMVYLDNGVLYAPGRLEQTPPRITFTSRPGQRIGDLEDAVEQLLKGVAVRVDFSSDNFQQLQRMVRERTHAPNRV